MRKIIYTLVFVFFINILPLLFKPQLLLQYKSLIILLFSLAIFLTQPAFSMEETLENKKTDRFSILIILIAGGISVDFSLIEWAYFSKQTSNLFFTIAGITISVGGLLLRVWSITALGKFFTATATASKQHLLIKSGPYAYVRHPSYTGAIMAIIGVPILLNNVITIVTTIILLAIAYTIRINIEEKVLISRFGDDYIQYTNSVKKIIPFIW